ncbi:putative bifunctional diguanylate cyclase/phosphodiesterase [Salinihabitans flavidus]|nr:EAL domain-containing protein [Salinihabitans flavidus]
MPVERADLIRAFDDGDLLLHYQPQVNVSGRWPEVIGYEALSRWPLPDGRFVPPDRFIPVAEDCGLILTLDIWVIDAVCREMARVKTDDASRSLSMAVNVSSKQFGQKHFAKSVAEILTRTGVDPSCLVLEITERAVLDEDETTFSNIHALREIGISLSLDDFGTGYSSLFHLRTLPIQEIKLDRSFVSGLPHRHRDAAILSATIDLASNLGLRVVAEGVELAQQSEWLRMNGCQTIQGFLYGRPAARSHHAITS